MKGNWLFISVFSMVGMLCCIYTAFGQPGYNDALGKKYWWLRSRLRTQYVVVGYETGSKAYEGSSVYGIPAGDKYPTNDIRYAKKFLLANGQLQFRTDWKWHESQAYWRDSCGAFDKVTEQPFTGTQNTGEKQCKSTAGSYRLQVGDGIEQLAWYMGVLATEYKLLANQGASQDKLNETLFELFCAFKAMQRLEVKAHTLIYGTSSCSTAATYQNCLQTGILLRDDIDFYEKATATNGHDYRVLKQDVIRNLNTTDLIHAVYDPDGYKAVATTDYLLITVGQENKIFKGLSHVDTALTNRYRKHLMSPDHVVHLLMGLGLVKKLVPHGDIKIYDGVGNVHGVFSFSGYIDSYLNRLKTTLINDGFQLKAEVGGDHLSLLHWGQFEGGPLLAYHILVSIDRIINNNYGDYVNCGLPYNSCTSPLLGLSKDLIYSLIRPNIPSSYSPLIHQYSVAYVASAVAQSSPYIMGFQVRNYTRNTIASNACDAACNSWGWFCSACPNLKTPYLCLNLDALITDPILISDWTGLLQIVKTLNLTSASGVGNFIPGHDPTRELCFVDFVAVFSGVRLIPDISWVYNVTHLS